MSQNAAATSFYAGDQGSSVRAGATPWRWGPRDLGVSEHPGARHVYAVADLGLGGLGRGEFRLQRLHVGRLHQEGDRRAVAGRVAERGGLHTSRLVKRAGIDKRISPHSLRHSFITAALDAGVPLRDVQEAASHADPRTTMRYDRARRSLDRHATYIVSTFIAGATRPG